MSSFTSEHEIMTEQLPQIAERAVKKIDSKLECSICLEYYKEPKLLPCFHVFCKSPCLERLVVQGIEGPSITCPSCRKFVILKDNGVDGLQTDFHIEHLFEIRESLQKAQTHAYQCHNCHAESTAVKYCQQCSKLMCERCTEVHQKWGDFQNHEILDVDRGTSPRNSGMFSPARPFSTCQKHCTVEAKIFCKTCRVLTCSDCTVSIHKDHEFSLVDEVLPKYKKELTSSLRPLQDKLDEVKHALKVFDTRALEIKNRKTSIESNITLRVERLHRCLDQRKEQLIHDLESENDQKLKELATQKDAVEMLFVKMSSCLEYAEECLREATEGKLLAQTDTVLKRIEQIRAEFDPKSIEPRTEADIELVHTATVEEECREFGKIVTDPASAELSFAIGSGTVSAIASYQASVEVHAKTVKDKKLEGKADLSAELVHLKSKAFTKCRVNQENGRHTITYQPIIRGKHSLYIRVNKMNIHGSPFPIAVTPSLESLRRPRVVRGLCLPHCLTTNSKRQVLAIEHENRTKHCITVLTPGAEKLLSIGTRGTKNGQFNSPCGLAVDRDDNIYVADNHRIQKFTSEGKFVAAVGGSHGSQDLQFMSPSGLAFDKVMHYLYVCDQLNNRIHVLTTDLDFVMCFGAKGSGHGQFSSPTSVIFDESNNLYVTDSGNNRVQVLTAEGQFLRAFSDKASGEKMQQPFAIAIDSGNVVYVSERERNVVSLFTAGGKHIISFGTKGTKEGQFSKIRGLHVDQDDSILVSDHKNNRIQVF